MPRESHFIVSELQKAGDELNRFPILPQKPSELLRSIARLRVKLGGLFESACDAGLIPDVMPKDEMRTFLVGSGAPKALNKAERFSYGVWISVAMPWLRRLKTGHLRAQAGDFYCPKVMTDKNGRILGLDSQIIDGFGNVRATGDEEIAALLQKHPELIVTSGLNLTAFFKANPDWGGRVQHKTIGTEKVNTDYFDHSDWLSWLRESAADDADGCRALADVIEACRVGTSNLSNRAITLLAIIRLFTSGESRAFVWHGGADSFVAKRLPENWDVHIAKVAFAELRSAGYVAESPSDGGKNLLTLRMATLLPRPSKSQEQSTGGKKKPKINRKRLKRTEPTIDMMKAHTLWQNGSDFRSIGKELRVSHEAARGWVKAVNEFLKKNRSVKTQALPSDRRGGVHVAEE